MFQIVPQSLYTALTSVLVITSIIFPRGDNLEQCPE